jgi:hypothetical protein
MKAKLFLLMISILSLSAPAQSSEALSDDLKNEISKDLQINFAQKIQDAASLNTEEESVLSAKDQKVMMKALYAGVEGPLSLAGVHISEPQFYSKVGKLLLAGAKYGVLPAAITIGFFKRAELIVGKTFATELNFYLDHGVLKVSTYDLNTLQVGLSASAKLGYYVALCYGACTGGDGKGAYVGIDADVVYGAGANIYIEVGVDTTDFYKARKIGQSYSMAELYEAKAVYIGAGIDVGVGVGFSMGFTDYDLKSDREIIDLYAIMDKLDFGARVRQSFNRARLFSTAPRLH